MKNDMQIIKILSGNITAFDGKNYYLCDLRGNLKKNNKICVGDFVEFETNAGDKERIVVTKILERKNQLIRPTISNIDNLLITITKKPSPDLNLVDALIIYCRQMGIEPILVISKMDLVDDVFVRDINNQYSKVVDHIVPICSLKNENLEELKELLKGKVSALAGQSAVGKSTLINALGGLNLEIGDLSAKLDRGKHTTRMSEIFILPNNIKIADTPGFSMLEVKIDDPTELKFWYDDFIPLQEECEFKDCDHINCKAKTCAVVKAVEDGKLSKERFARYVARFNKLKEKWERKYD